RICTEPGAQPCAAIHHVGQVAGVGRWRSPGYSGAYGLMIQFGVTMFPSDYAMSVVDLGRAAEDHGFESLFVPEHTHIPVKRETPWPGGGDLPREYSHTLDPSVALGAVAAVTGRTKLGTGICRVIQRDPIVLAKEVASLD